MSKSKIGDRIKLVRKDQMLTQEDFGSQIGVKGNTVTGYEKGTRSPSDAVLNSICLVFDVNQTWLRTGEGEMYIEHPSSLSVLERVFEAYNCNPLEKKFLNGYFSLKETDRDAFCDLLKKMFPNAVSVIGGSDALARPIEWQEAEPVQSIKPDIAAILQKAPAERTEAEIEALTEEFKREIIEEKEAAVKSLDSSELTGSQTEKKQA